MCSLDLGTSWGGFSLECGTTVVIINIYQVRIVCQVHRMNYVIWEGPVMAPFYGQEFAGRDWVRYPTPVSQVEASQLEVPIPALHNVGRLPSAHSAK